MTTDVLGAAVHLLSAGEVFRQGYPSTLLAACGEPVTSGPDEDEVEPRYCDDCVRAALRRERAGLFVVSDPQIEIPAVCEVHGGSGRLVVRRDGDRIVLDGSAQCCVFTLEGPAVTVLFDVIGEWLG